MGKKSERDAERKRLAIIRNNTQAACEAAAAGNEEEFNKLLPQADLNLRMDFEAPDAGADILAFTLAMADRGAIPMSAAHAALDRVIQEGVDIRGRRFEGGLTYLMVGVLYGDDDIVKKLLPLSDLDALSEGGRNPEQIADDHGKPSAGAIIRGYRLSAAEDKALEDLLPKGKPSTGGGGGPIL